MNTGVEKYDAGISGIRDLDLCRPLDDGNGDLVTLSSNSFVPVHRHLEPRTLKVCEAFMIF